MPAESQEQPSSIAVASEAPVSPDGLTWRLPGVLSSLLARTGTDRAVFFGVLWRFWQLASGPGTLLLIARYMSAESQGYYYTFGSIVALQSFLELGFYLVIINFSSHEWSMLALDATGRITGDRNALSRLVSLGRLVFKWYGILAGAFVATVGPAGYLFFSRSQPTHVHWVAPWFALVAATGGLLWLLPFVSMLEGCNQIAYLNRYRLWQAIIGNIALWITIAAGGGLWASAVWAAVNLARDGYLLIVRYKRFFEPFFHPPTFARVAWKTEIWPMQWRLALSGIVNYFAFSLFNPVMFRYHGAAVAGQMGMTWTLLTGVQTLSLMWIYPNVPKAGIMIAKRQFAELDRFWLRVSAVSVGATVLGLTVAVVGTAALRALNLKLASRLLPSLPMVVLSVGIVGAQVTQCMSAYLRAHKQEPIVAMSVTSSIFIGLLVWLLGIRYGPLGATAGYMIVTIVVAIPWETLILIRCRREWHAPVS